jgi:hypothetical protein
MSLAKIAQTLKKWSSLGGEQIVITPVADDFVFRGLSYTSEDYIELAIGKNYFLTDPVNIDNYGWVAESLSFSSTVGPLVLTFYEGTDYTGGTSLTIFNRNRVKPVRAPKLTITSGATGTTLGTKLYAVGGGDATNPQNTSGSNLVNDSLIVYNPDDKILVEADNQTGAALKVSYAFTWFELG